ncbi:sushi, von Willebrand factor type A, EGF and pentraxin domain-containing protein 1-like isoform X11 [Dreissena polymorpha]|uniref:sushi, von Willebrand factor type A, EGF and pentraxin domain-containing protein 1-like isoform X11 n=1 Tax=Dreissena polymorpha TaxID=45954 RepID=UPI002263C08C|nr:sushi, von Willebrand factor type A, EGF and pentraxin domain-containing protein 1-like isoform X11 [Dreissena polymorpha]
MASVKTTTMSAFLVAIYIGVFCSASSNAENNGCLDLDNHTNWQAIGPHIQEIKYVRSSNRFRASVQCEPGYQGFVLFQQKYSDRFPMDCINGSWTFASPCMEVVCPDISNNDTWKTNGENIQRIEYLPSSLSTVTAHCLNGYEAISHNSSNDHFSVKCEQGVWVAEVAEGACQKKDCGPPLDWAHGTCIATNTTYQSIGLCSCNTGYTFTGRNNSIECLANGSWRVPDVNCTIKNCGNPLADPHRHDDTSNGTVFLSTVTFRCNEGYELVGANTSVCTELSKWRPDVPNCKIKDCGHPPDLAYGTCIAINTTFKSIVLCSCNTGYTFTGQNSGIECLANGSWRGPDGSCTIKNCGPPPYWAYGRCITTKTTYQSTGRCSCNTGYTFTGRNTSIECLANGSWRVPDGNCTIKNCGNPLADPHRHDDKSNGTVFLSTVTFWCNEGYELVGANTSVCTELSKWRPDVPNCKIKDCGHPPDLAYGTCIAINTTFKSIVLCSCNTGYTFTGQNSGIECLANGSWRGPDGSCTIKNCGPPPYWSYGTCITTKTTYLSTGRCSCNTGYTFTGRNNSIECLANGSWRVPDGNCTIKNCGNPLADPHRQDDTSNGTVFLSTVTFLCNDGYELVGANTSGCTELSKWRPEVPNCKIKDCVHPPDLAYGTCIATNTTFQSIGLCSCITGYTLTGQNSIECLANGSWRGPDGICTIKNCENPFADPNRHDDTSNGTVYLSTVTFSCHDGYELVGANTSICTALSTWRPQVPNCKIKDCGPPPDLAHGTCIATSTTFRSIGRCSCTTGYHFTGRNSSTKCLSNGSWRGLDGSCAIKEPVIISFETNGSRFNGDNNILDTFQIPNRFPYFGTYYTLFRPSMNGFIALDFQPLYNQYGGETPSEWTAAIQKHIVIAPLWTDIDSRNISNGGLWIHVLTERDKADVLNIQDRVRQYTNQTEFNVSVALVATWKHVTVHSPYEPGYELVNHQNLSMQVILVTDGMFTYIMFNYDREQFSIRPLPEVSVASGYTHLDYSASVLSTRNNFTNLIKESNVNPSFPGRWLYNVTAITVSMLNETRCLQFVKANNYTLQSFITEQLVYALPCPCQEVLMLEDYTFTRKDEILPGIGTKFTHTTCYESWFFSAYGIKQRCCYMFSKLQSQYPGAVAAEFENSTIASLLQEGYYQCCSPDGSQKYCHLYQQINPPDDCSRYTISDEIQMADKKDSAKIEDLSVDVEK